MFLTFRYICKGIAMQYDAVLPNRYLLLFSCRHYPTILDGDYVTLLLLVFSYLPRIMGPALQLRYFTSW